LYFEDADLRVAILLDDRADDRGALDARAAHAGLALPADEENVLDGHGGADRPASRSTRTTSPFWTRYCLPPVLMIAYTALSPSGSTTKLRV